MAKETFSCCGGRGKHLGGCDNEPAPKGKRKPPEKDRAKAEKAGPNQARLLWRLARSGDPRSTDGYGKPRLNVYDRRVLETMQAHGWVAQDGDSWTMTAKGRKAYEHWQDSDD